MHEIHVTSTPLDLGAALGLAASGGVASRWRVQNRGPSTVYRTEGTTAPDPATVRGFRHGSGSVLEVRIIEGTPCWVWTATATADLVVEPA